MHIDDLLVEQVAFEQQVRVVLRHRRRRGMFPHPQPSRRSQLKLSDRKKSQLRASGPVRQLQHQSQHMVRIGRG
jgi:hypothetical protein